MLTRGQTALLNREANALFFQGGVDFVQGSGVYFQLQRLWQATIVECTPVPPDDPDPPGKQDVDIEP